MLAAADWREQRGAPAGIWPGAADDHGDGAGADTGDPGARWTIFLVASAGSHLSCRSMAMVLVLAPLLTIVGALLPPRLQKPAAYARTAIAVMATNYTHREETQPSFSGELKRFLAGGGGCHPGLRDHGAFFWVVFRMSAIIRDRAFGLRLYLRSNGARWRRFTRSWWATSGTTRPTRHERADLDDRLPGDAWRYRRCALFPAASADHFALPPAGRMYRANITSAGNRLSVCTACGNCYRSVRIMDLFCVNCEYDLASDNSPGSLHALR